MLVRNVIAHPGRARGGASSYERSVPAGKGLFDVRCSRTRNPVRSGGRFKTPRCAEPAVQQDLPARGLTPCTMIVLYINSKLVFAERHSP